MEVAMSLRAAMVAMMEKDRRAAEEEAKRIEARRAELRAEAETALVRAIQLYWGGPVGDWIEWDGDGVEYSVPVNALCVGNDQVARGVMWVPVGEVNERGEQPVVDVRLALRWVSTDKVEPRVHFQATCPSLDLFAEKFLGPNIPESQGSISAWLTRVAVIVAGEWAKSQARTE